MNGGGEGKGQYFFTILFDAPNYPIKKSLTS